MLSQQLRRILMSSNCTEQAIEELIGRGADPFLPNKNGDNSIIIAINRRYPINIINRLLPDHLIPDNRINMINHRGDSAISLSVLIYDSSSVDLELFRLLHRAGANFRTKLSGTRPLIATALRNKYTSKQVRELFKWDIRVEFEDIRESLQLSRLDVINPLLDKLELDETESNRDHLNCQQLRDHPNCQQLRDHPNCQQLRTAVPNALALLIRHFDAKRSSNYGQLSKVFRRLIEEFNVDINYTDSVNPPILHLLIMKHRKQFNGLIDQLLSRQDLDLNCVHNQVTPLTASLNRGLNHVAEKLILAGCCVFGTDVQNIVLRPGCSVPLKLMFIHGFRLPESIDKIGHFPPVKFYSDCDGSSIINSHEKRRHDIERELLNLKRWLSERSGSNFPRLGVLAARVVRPLFEHYVEEFRSKRCPNYFIERLEQMVFLEQSWL